MKGWENKFSLSWKRSRLCLLMTLHLFKWFCSLLGMDLNCIDTYYYY